jgi:hypothetical protein
MLDYIVSYAFCLGAKRRFGIGLSDGTVRHG